jgi:hypothetical protein
MLIDEFDDVSCRTRHVRCSYSLESQRSSILVANGDLHRDASRRPNYTRIGANGGARADGRRARSEWNLTAIPGAENISVMSSTRSTIERRGYYLD